MKLKHKINRLSARNILAFSILFSLVLLSQISCKKSVAIGPPKNSITTEQSFADSTDAASAIAGIYSNLANAGGNLGFANGNTTLLTGSSADELLPFGFTDQISGNSLTADNSSIAAYFWNQPYAYIYQANASIEGLQSSTGLSINAKNQFLGEAKFLRAFCYFYLVNFFGDVPYVTSTDYATTQQTARASKSLVYQNIINDLLDAQKLLRADYSFSVNERIRANKWAATALLARVYLYAGDWGNAEAQANSIISNSSLFSLNPVLNNVFLKNTTEAILQWKPNNAFFPYNATFEGRYNIPSDHTQPPYYYLNAKLSNAFEAGDKRKIAWLDSTNYSGTKYYFPFKYKVGPTQSVANANVTEYYMVLRLAEQYLIRAEARANGAGSGLSGAINDLNIIRTRAGLSNYAGAALQAPVLSAIYHERQIELFAEWGHRWLDLKRLGQVDAIMNTATPLKNQGTIWQSYQQLYPIPLLDIQRDPKLTQNTGY